jgi:tetratricopeptide (TPR) repeat protein
MARVFSDRAFRAGLKAYENAAFGEAAGYFTRALRLCRDSSYAWLYYARSSEARGEYNECVPAYEKALALFERGGIAVREITRVVKKKLNALRRVPPSGEHSP